MGARDFGDERANAINWLCCLRNNSIARSRRKIPNVGEFTDDNRIGKISHQTTHFDVIAETDHGRKIAGMNESFQLFMRVSHERTCGVCHNQITLAESFALFVRSAVSGNQNSAALRRLAGGIFANSLSPELLAHDRVVKQFTQNGERGLASERARLGNGVAHAETHAKMFCNDDSHLLCMTKLGHKIFSFPSRAFSFRPESRNLLLLSEKVIRDVSTALDMTTGVIFCRLSRFVPALANIL